MIKLQHGVSGQTTGLTNFPLSEILVIGNARRAGYGSPSARRISGKTYAKPRVSEELSPLELLRQENELLRETINSADKDIEEIEAQLQVMGPVNILRIKGKAQCCIALHWQGHAACSACNNYLGAKTQLQVDMPQEEGVDVNELEQKLVEEDEGDAKAQQEVDNPEDYWSPVSDPIRAGNVDEYGLIQPVPQHDGTECLKWDDSLWSHADHFKVCCLPSCSVRPLDA